MIISLLGRMHRVPSTAETKKGDSEGAEATKRAHSSGGGWEWVGIWSFKALTEQDLIRHVEGGKYNHHNNSGSNQNNNNDGSNNNNNTNHNTTNSNNNNNNKNRNSKGVRGANLRNNHNADHGDRPRPFRYKFLEPVDATTVEILSLTTTTTTATTSTTTTTTSSANNKHSEDVPLTYGSNGYVDAGMVHPDHCPRGGSWTGQFENVDHYYSYDGNNDAASSGGSSDNTHHHHHSTPHHRPRQRYARSSSVKETFHLYFGELSSSSDPNNSSNSNNNSSSKEDKDKKHSNANSTTVRGRGQNAFGTFEILGVLDRSNGLLHCRRTYAPVVTAASPHDTIGSPRGRTVPPTRVMTRVRSRSVKLDDMVELGDGTGSNKYYTRKKRMSWQKSTDGSPSTTSHHAGEGGDPLTPSETTTTTTTSRRKMSEGGSSSGKSRKRSRASSLDPTNNNNNNNNLSDHTPSVDEHDERSEQRSKYQRSSESSSSSSLKECDETKRSSAMELVIPRVGHPKEARWRAAHYMFYLPAGHPDNTLDSSSGDGSGSNGIPPQPMYAVYEGEMNRGNQERDGLGVCLYPIVPAASSPTGRTTRLIYQGCFKKNKEHGKGILFDAGMVNLTDEKGRPPQQPQKPVVLYRGDWERGKMHGRGTCRYPDGGIYTGDFKENARHGLGTYVLSGNKTDTSTASSSSSSSPLALLTPSLATLADGVCVYEGEWRDNLPSGRGTFRWDDGSTYTGTWKDGVRHGQGVLRCSDGFSYDGMWNHNCMEGRGIAVYPDGQRYEGLWANGKKEGRGTVRFTNGAVYEGRFRDDRMEGQGTMKMVGNVILPAHSKGDNANGHDNNNNDDDDDKPQSEDERVDWMIPIQFQSDMGHIHKRAGFTEVGE